MDFKRVGKQVFIFTPYLRDNRFRAQQSAFIQRQCFQDLNFFGGQPQPLILRKNLMSFNVNPKLPTADNRFLSAQSRRPVRLRIRASSSSK